MKEYRVERFVPEINDKGQIYCPKSFRLPQLSTLESEDIRYVILFSPVQEAHVGEETVLILGVAELSKELLDILLGDLVSEIAEDVVQLS